MKTEVASPREDALPKDESLFNINLRNSYG